MVFVKEDDTELYRKDTRTKGSTLSVADREKLVKKYLPEPNLRQRPQRSKKGKKGSKPQKPQPIRTFLRSQFHFLVYFVIQIFFSIYIRLRQSYHAVIDRILAILYYHHRTPELIQKDVKGLSRLPEHLSVLLTLKREDEALEILMDEVAELTAWTVCAGIPILSVYEKTGR
jgi:dehydrodolichyl diphosphate syntase complex subunit NUS1